MTRVLQLVRKEILHRWPSFLVSTLGVCAAVAACVTLVVTQEATQRETRRVTRDIGFNLRILPRQTDMNQFWRNGFSTHTMPEEAVHRIAQQKNVSYNHLVAVLQRQVDLGECEAILTGLSDEVAPPGRKKPPMSFSIESGTVHVGHEITRQLGLQRGDSLSLNGEDFRVVRCMPESGTSDDIRVFGHLDDVQRVLDESGRINEIKAIDCLCMTADEDPLAILREELEAALPEGRVLLMSQMADARARQRRMTERYGTFITALLIVAASVWVGALATVNVRQRSSEIGLLRALGYGGGSIAGIVLGRALLIGLAGALAGFALGGWLAAMLGPELFPITAKSIRLAPSLLGYAVAGAVLMSMGASFIPAALAIKQDPAVTLQQV